MEPHRRSAGGAVSEASSAAGSEAEDDRYCSANSALGTPSSLATLLPTSDFWDHQMDLLLDDHPVVFGFPKNHQLSRLLAQTPAQSPPGTEPPPPAAAGGDALARQGSSPSSQAVPPCPDHSQVGLFDDNDLFDDMVQEMEQILLSSGEPHENGSSMDNRKSNARHAHHFRDGSTTASTSGTDDAYVYPLPQYSSRIDWVEVVGAKQRTGDVSFGERMVGVKEYTVYVLKVRGGEDEWEIERRYREFYALYRQLKDFFYERGLGVRRYLLDGNDFFALRDLVDLSKGAFAALPIKVQTISNRILEHITEQCLVCYDAGVPCAARQACDDPLSLIFPFQEDEATKCGSCASIFHKQCFRKISVCPCGKASSAARKIVALEQAVDGVMG
nr:unnamed protein product [Digitaria exilis]